VVLCHCIDHEVALQEGLTDIPRRSRPIHSFSTLSPGIGQGGRYGTNHRADRQSFHLSTYKEISIPQYLLTQSPLSIAGQLCPNAMTDASTFVPYHLRFCQYNRVPLLTRNKCGSRIDLHAALRPQDRHLLSATLVDYVCQGHQSISLPNFSILVALTLYLQEMANKQPPSDAIKYIPVRKGSTNHV
jgi:hypothetical protein